MRWCAAVLPAILAVALGVGRPPRRSRRTLRRAASDGTSEWRETRKT